MSRELVERAIDGIEHPAEAATVRLAVETLRDGADMDWPEALRLAVSVAGRLRAHGLFGGPGAPWPPDDLAGDVAVAIREANAEPWPTHLIPADRYARAALAEVARRMPGLRQPRVFRQGAPEPDGVRAVAAEGVYPLIVRLRPELVPGDTPECRWQATPMLWTWEDALRRGPLVEVILPDVAAVAAGDAKAGQS